MWFIYSILTLLCWGFFNFSLKVFADKEKSPYVNMASIYFVANSFMWVYLFIRQETFQLSLELVLLGVLLGLCSAAGNYCFTKAFETGISSIIAPVVSSNSIIVILLSLLFLGESINIRQGIAIFLAFTSVLLLNYSRQKNESTETDWMIYMALTFLAFGGVNTIMKLTVYFKEPPNAVLAIGFTIAFFLYLILCIRNAEPLKQVVYNKLNLFAILNPIGMILYGLALRSGWASLVCPITSCNSIITVIFGLTLYKERLNKYQLFAILGVFISIILLGIES
ncbi:hypothetical protein JCM14036_00900 [Desulfotomaculum defluvii]